MSLPVMIEQYLINTVSRYFFKKFENDFDPELNVIKSEIYGILRTSMYGDWITSDEVEKVMEALANQDSIQDKIKFFKEMGRINDVEFQINKNRAYDNLKDEIYKILG